MTRAKAQYSIKENGVLKPITKKEFLRLRDEEIKSNYVGKSLLVKNKQFTQTQLDTYERQELLKPLKYKGKIFYPREQLIDIIDSEPSQRRMSF